MVQRDILSRKVARATAWIKDAEALLQKPRIYEDASTGVTTLRRFLVAVADHAGL